MRHAACLSSTVFTSQPLKTGRCHGADACSWKFRQNLHNALRGTTVAKWIGHNGRSQTLAKKFAGLFDDHVFIGANDEGEAGLHRFVPLRISAKNQHGDTETGRFLLYSALVGENEPRTREQEQELRIRHRFKEMDVGLRTQKLGDRSAHGRV